MKKGNIVSLSILLFASFSGCSSQFSSYSISLKGTVEETIEAGTEYVESGINIPENYTYSVKGIVFSQVVGRYELVYNVYSNTGELEKELHRFVNVIDTTAPTYQTTSISDLAINHQYSINDFISDYSDNSTSKSLIKVEANSELLFTKKGKEEIIISFTDQFGNSSTYRKEYNVVFNANDFVDEMKEEGKVKFSEDENVGKSLRIQIDTNTSIAYYFNNDQYIFFKRIESDLGNYSSISIYVANNNFSKAEADIYVSNYDTYSIGFLTIDLSKEYNEFNFTKFNSVINKLSLNENDMLNVFNQEGLSVFNEFLFYLNYDWSEVTIN